jgi:hypothetical protein
MTTRVGEAVRATGGSSHAITYFCLKIHLASEKGLLSYRFKWTMNSEHNFPLRVWFFALTNRFTIDFQRATLERRSLF